MPLVNEQAKAVGVICTYSGALVDLRNMTPADVKLIDIAHAISQCNRWHGATRRPYSVASHCLAVASFVAAGAQAQGMTAENQRVLTLAALLHDGTEAYVIDLPAPIKQLPGFEAYGALEDGVARAVAGAFGIGASYFAHPLVKQADKLAAVCEAHLLIPGSAAWAGPKPDAATLWTMVRKARSPRQERDTYMQAVQELAGPQTLRRVSLVQP